MGGLMERVRLVHGNGGRFSHELTERFILKYFTNTNDINRYFLLLPLFFTLNPLKIRQYGCIVQDA